MSDLPPSTPPRKSASRNSPDDLLQTGLAALKQQDYTSAIQHLSKLSQDPSVTGATRLKACIGLVKALKGSGQTTAAIALAQKLSTHSHTQVQEWAKKQLAQWEQLPQLASEPSSGPASEDLSGFQPLDADPASTHPSNSRSAQSSPVLPPTDLSGFQPLDTSVQHPGKESSLTANPLADQADKGSHEDLLETVAEELSTPSAPTVDESAMPGVLESIEDAEQSPDQASTGASLFHYEQLNQFGQPAVDPVVEADDLAPYGPQPHVVEASIAAAMADSEDGETAELIQFQNAGRLLRLRALPKIPQENLQVWGLLIGSAIALFWLCRVLVQGILGQLAGFLSLFAILPIPLGWSYQDHTFLLLFILVGLLFASPWLLDGLLKYTAGLKPLSIHNLHKTHPEGCRLLRRVAHQRGWLLPLLRELPTETPLIFSYGWLPRYTRIVVSHGLLTQLTDQEVATLIGYELNHCKTWTMPYFSLVALLLQGFHQGYWQAARWGDRRPDRLTKGLAAVGSSLCYALYWMIRQLHLPLSRARVLGSDRQAVEWTGNPNALTRALIKLAHNKAEAIVQTGYTPPLLESTDLIAPSSYQGTISPGSIFPDVSFLEILRWDIYNPYRRWLSINASHPRLGERLKRLAGYALKWQLSPEIPFPQGLMTGRRLHQPTFRDRWLPFLQQMSPYIGPLVGIGVAMGLWFLSGILEPLGIQRVDWVYGDLSVLWGSLLLGLGMGIMVRINPYFPDITDVNRWQNPPIPTLLNDPTALPTDSYPVRLEGRLLGRRGMANWLCQDFILETSSGLLKLHFLSVLGSFGNLLIHPQHPSESIGHSVKVQGWFRRGAIAWVDIDTITLKSGRVVAQANHPMWSVVLSLVFCGLGLLVLLRG